MPTVNLVGRPVPEIDGLPEGPYRALVVQGHELSTRTFAVIGPEVKNPRKRYAGNKQRAFVNAQLLRRLAAHAESCGTNAGKSLLHAPTLVPTDSGPIACHARLGGTLNFYYREAA